MDRNAITILRIVALVVAGTAGGMVLVQTKRAREERVRAEGLERQIDAAGKAEMELRAEAVQQAKRIEAAQVQASEAEQRVAKVKAELAAIKSPPEDKPNCIDSDASRGADAIYVRGSVRVGGGTSFDHCRLGQLVEFSCIENPVGSGRFIPDATIADCPAGSRCVEGECLR